MDKTITKNSTKIKNKTTTATTDKKPQNNFFFFFPPQNLRKVSMFSLLWFEDEIDQIKISDKIFSDSSLRDSSSREHYWIGNNLLSTL